MKNYMKMSEIIDHNEVELDEFSDKELKEFLIMFAGAGTSLIILLVMAASKIFGA